MDWGGQSIKGTWALIKDINSTHNFPALKYKRLR